MVCRVLCVLLFVVWTAEYREEKGGLAMYGGLWQSPFIAFEPLVRSLPGVRLSPVQLTLLALVPLALVAPGALRRRAWPLDGAIAAALLALGLTVLWGAARGGSLYQAYFQLGRLLMSLLAALLLASSLRTPRQLRLVLGTVVAAAVTRASLVLYGYYAHMRGRELDVEFVTGHEDSLLFAAAFLIVAGWALDRARLRAWLLAAPLFALVAWAIVLNGRRIAYIEIAAGLAFAFLLLPRQRRRRLFRRGLILSPALAAYVVAGWGRSEPVFAPLHAFSTAGSLEDVSSLARLEEITNLMHTYAGNPLLGTGWGHAYREISSIYTRFDPSIGFWQYGYLPHNSLLGLVAFAGIVGLLGVWLLIPVAAFLATRAYGLAETRLDRVSAMTALALLPAYSVHCYGDIGLNSLNCGLVAAVALGLAAATAVRTGAWPGTLGDPAEDEDLQDEPAAEAA